MIRVPQTKAPQSRYRVISFDDRGAGKSNQIDEPMSMRDMALDTIGLMETLGIADAHVVGRSMQALLRNILLLNAPIWGVLAGPVRFVCQASFRVRNP